MGSLQNDPTAATSLSDTSINIINAVLAPLGDLLFGGS